MSEEASLNPTVAELGERRVIRLLSRFMAPPGGDVLVPVGDDCAVLAPPAEPVREILTTDMLVEGTHFLRNCETDWYGLGRKAAAANISDIASTGGWPVSLLISLGLPGDFPVADLQALYRGLADESARWGGALVGGDTTRSPVLVINVAVTGRGLPGEALPLRSNCRPGQSVYLSGALGGSLGGLQLLVEPDFRDLRSARFAPDLVQRHWLPEPRVPLGRALAGACGDLAMIDISDGLFNELHLLSEASGVRIEVDLDAIPLWPGVSELAETVGGEADRYRLFSGEEYELLFATAVDEAVLQGAVAGIEPGISRIGRVVAGRGVVLLRGGKAVEVRDRTFAHFGSPKHESDSGE